MTTTLPNDLEMVTYTIPADHIVLPDLVQFSSELDSPGLVWVLTTLYAITSPAQPGPPADSAEQARRRAPDALRSSEDLPCLRRRCSGDRCLMDAFPPWFCCQPPRRRRATVRED